MKQYLTEIIVPYVEAQRDLINEPNTSAVVIIDNFKGQVTPAIFEILEKDNIHSQPTQLIVSSRWMYR